MVHTPESMSSQEQDFENNQNDLLEKLKDPEHGDEVLPRAYRNYFLETPRSPQET